MTKDRIPALIVFVISCGFLAYFIYALVPELSLRINNNEGIAKVIEWEKVDSKNYIIYNYVHDDGHEYTIRKEIKRPKLKSLQGKNSLSLVYSKHFPGHTMI